VEQALFLVRVFSHLLVTDPTHPMGGAGERVAGIAPFVFNGDAKSWPAVHLITDPEAFKLFGRFMRGERFYFPGRVPKAA
jgi:hypothetical protein